MHGFPTQNKPTILCSPIRVHFVRIGCLPIPTLLLPHSLLGDRSCFNMAAAILPRSLPVPGTSALNQWLLSERRITCVHFGLHKQSSPFLRLGSLLPEPPSSYQPLSGLWPWVRLSPDWYLECLRIGTLSDSCQGHEGAASLSFLALCDEIPASVVTGLPIATAPQRDTLATASPLHGTWPTCLLPQDCQQ